MRHMMKYIQKMDQEMDQNPTSWYCFDIKLLFLFHTRTDAKQVNEYTLE